jgi:hypothetical protein
MRLLDHCAALSKEWNNEVSKSMLELNCLYHLNA